MPVTRHPPRRSQHAELPHWAPTSGSDAQALGKIRLMLRGSLCSRSSLATCRTRLGAFCKAAWPCVQTLVCLTGFPLVSLLSSTTSADQGAPWPLFGASQVLWGCPTSHFCTSLACPLGVPRADLSDPFWGQLWDLPVPVHGVSVHAKVYDRAEPERVSR